MNQIDFTLISCEHDLRPRSPNTCARYCRKCNSVILYCFCSYHQLYVTLTHEVFHNVFCSWHECAICRKFDKMPNCFQATLGV